MPKTKKEVVKKPSKIDKLPKFHQRILEMFKMNRGLTLNLLNKLKDHLQCEVAYKKLGGNVYSSNYSDGKVLKLEGITYNGRELTFRLRKENGAVGNWLYGGGGTRSNQVNCMLSLNIEGDYKEDEFIELAIKRELVSQRETVTEIQKILQEELDKFEKEAEHILKRINNIKLNNK